MTNNYVMSKRGLESLSASQRRWLKKEARRLALDLRAQREALDGTQESVAEELDISAGTVKGIELGYRLPSLPLLLRLADNLGLRVILQKK